MYVDKTARIAEMVGAASSEAIAPRLQGGSLSESDKLDYAALQSRGFKYVFLARPRRFGKSLLVSTLESLFLGQQDHCRGTWIHDHGNWAWQQHPVVRLDLSARALTRASELQDALCRHVQVLCGYHRVKLPSDHWKADELLDYLIRALAAREGKRVVVLVDEYDAPIVHNLETPAQLQGLLAILHSLLHCAEGA